MDLTFTDEQALLAETARAFVERTRRAGPTTVGRANGLDETVWRSMCELGWTAIASVDPGDGTATNLLELVVLCEELGRGPLLSPLVASTVLAALPIALLGTPEQRMRWLPALATGEAVGTLAHFEPDDDDEWTPAAMAGGPELTGTKLLVPWADVAAVAVVTTDAGLFLLDPRQDTWSVTRHDDLGEPLFRLELTGAPAEPLGGAHDEHAAVLGGVLDRAAIAELAYAIGSAARATELSVEHARDRYQFDRPIGSFQAVAHRCVDMRTDLDACRYLAYQAAWALDHREHPEIEVAAALAYGKPALRRIFGHAHQVHGAVGFSAEHSLHLFTRRAKAFELGFGRAARHLERVAGAMGLG